MSIVLGLVGSVCAGKSRVARRFRELGAAVYEADDVVRQLYEQEDVRQEVRQLFGDSVFTASGSVDRAAIAKRVFSDDAGDALRRRLTKEIIFPRTGTVLRSKLGDFRATAVAGDVLVLDAPTLFEAGRADVCDRILWVTAPLERRREWAAARGWPPGELERREAALMAADMKRARSDFVIENTGSISELEAAVDRVWFQLRAGSCEPRTPGADSGRPNV
jgi:dephospho-CoA kinase